MLSQGEITFPHLTNNSQLSQPPPQRLENAPAPKLPQQQHEHSALAPSSRHTDTPKVDTEKKNTASLKYHAIDITQKTSPSTPSPSKGGSTALPSKDISTSARPSTREIIDWVLHGVRPQIESSLPSRLKDMLSRCWHNDPNIRPSFRELEQELELYHTYVTRNTNTTTGASLDSFGPHAPPFAFTKNNLTRETIKDLARSPLKLPTLIIQEKCVGTASIN